jgi:retron-type reverse transcriptase
VNDIRFSRRLGIASLERSLGLSRAFLRSIASTSGPRYKAFELLKASGGVRKIEVPDKELAQIQRLIHARLLRRLAFPEGMHGGIPGRSVLTNAQQHVGKRFVVTLDLKNCFGRISDMRIYEALMEELSYGREAAALVTKLTTRHYHLPQGAPSSPLLANLALLPLYRDVEAIARRAGVTASFFIDDIALSGDNAVSIVQSVVDCVHRHGHAVAHRKIRIMPASRPQLVTGILVNRKPALPRDVREGIRESILTGGGNVKSLAGRVGYLRWIQPHAGERLYRLLSDRWGLDDRSLAMHTEVAT